MRERDSGGYRFQGSGKAFTARAEVGSTAFCCHQSLQEAEPRDVPVELGPRVLARLVTPPQFRVSLSFECPLSVQFHEYFMKNAAFSKNRTLI